MRGWLDTELCLQPHTTGAKILCKRPYMTDSFLVPMFDVLLCEKIGFLIK